MTSSKKPTCPNQSFPSFFQVGCSVLHVVKTYFLISTYIWMLCEGAYLQVKAILDGKLLLCKNHWNYVYLFPAAVEVHLGCEALADLHPGGLGMDPPGRRHRPLHRGKNENGGQHRRRSKLQVITWKQYTRKILNNCYSMTTMWSLIAKLAIQIANHYHNFPKSKVAWKQK